MTNVDEDCGRRERLLLQTATSSSSLQQQQQQQQQQQPSYPPVIAPTPVLPQFPPGERFNATNGTSSNHGDRFPPGERFSSGSSTPDRYSSGGAATPERYHPPASSQERYGGTAGAADRYVAPPAPTPERYTPENRLERYTPTNGSERYPDRYSNQNSDRYPPGERYIPPPAPSGVERYINNIPNQNGGVGERFAKSPIPGERYQAGDRYLQDRYANNYLQTSADRYPPPPAPNERYVPNQNADRYATSFLPPSPNYLPNGGFIQPTTPVNPGDPYMRRDLGYHHHYRLPHPNYHPHHYHHHYHRALPPAPHHRYHQHILPSPNRSNHLQRCCPSPNHPSPTTGVSSTSSQTATPTSASTLVSVCGTPTGSREYLTASPSMSRGRTQRNSVTDFSATIQQQQRCGDYNTVPRTEFGARLSGNGGITTPVEYVGASGGRHVSTPPPVAAMLPRCASMSNCDVGMENPMCEHKASGGGGPHRPRGCMEGSTMSLCCGSARRYAGQVNVEKGEGGNGVMVSTPSHGTLQHHTSVWRAVGQSHVTPQTSPQPSPPGSTPVVGTSPTATPSSPPLLDSSCTPPSTATPSTASPTASGHHHVGVLERSISAPGPSSPSSTASAAPPRPPLQRSMSRSEVVRNYIRRETAVFFGVEEDCEEKEQAVWRERRKRLACRKYGQLREEFQPPGTAAAMAAQQQLTSAYATQQQSRDARPDVLPVGRDSTDLGRDAVAAPRWTEPPVRRKESVAKMTFGGLAYVVTALTRPRPRPTPRSRQYSRSYPLAAIPESSNLVGEYESDDTFFDRPECVPALTATPAALTAPGLPPAGGDMPGPTGDVPDARVHMEDASDAQSGGFSSGRDQLDASAAIREQYTARERDRPVAGWRRVSARNQARSDAQEPEAGPEVGCSRIWTRVLDRVFDNSDRRQYGMGFVGRFFGRSMRKSVSTQATVKEQLDDIEDYRPFFTYWITTVQVVILLMSVFCYGLGPIGFDLSNRSGEVLVTSLSLQQVEYQEPANFWIGPRAGDLIHLGAKFAPCMRKDTKIMKEIEKGREKERETACCIRNDDSGCVQSSQADCSVRGLGGPTKTISTWKKWSSGDSGPGGRMSGSVCGLDPKHCESPASVAPYEWPDDITKWPICRKSKSQNFRPRDKVAEHMVCEVIGHPCCIGIHGMCRITTKEYCDFVRGYFHEEASLCSQVACLDDVCGMIPFYSPEVPDQFYRLWTSLFLHAGIGHLAITLTVQWFLMRDLEKLTGPLRIGIIYMGSGIAGNLASAIFVPYRAEVGPAGAQFGLLACLIVEVLNVWPMLKHPDRALLKLLSVTLILFLFGLLPWVDNYAHLFGFIFGFLLSYALMPFVSFGLYDRHKKYILIWVCLLSALFLFVALVVLFYVIPVYDCEACNYFTCLPLTRDFCASQNINFRREEPVV